MRVIHLSNRRFVFNAKVNHQAFDDLLNYRDILKMKLETGKVKNKYAIINKIKQLEKEKGQLSLMSWA